MGVSIEKEKLEVGNDERQGTRVTKGMRTLISGCWACPLWALWTVCHRATGVSNCGPCVGDPLAKKKGPTSCTRCGGAIHGNCALSQRQGKGEHAGLAC